MRLESLTFWLIVAAILLLTFDLSRGQVASNQTTTTVPSTDAVGANSSVPEIPEGENPMTDATVTLQNTTAFHPCVNDVCQNGGTCLVNGLLTLGYQCQCADGWMGDNCTQRDFCYSSPCLNGGTCSQTTSGMTCQCTEDYTGEFCDTAIDRCTPNPCENNGICTNIPGDFNCTCPLGYGGKNCSVDTNLCDPNPCRNGATCIQNMMEISCSCAPGFTGQICDQEIDFCLSAPCQNNGTCVTHTGGFNCTCSLGFTGDMCETDIDDCLGVTCEHGGTCQDGIYSYSCLCAAGWTGSSCQTDINECEAPPGGNPVCDPNAVCQNTEGGYNCTCNPGYSGNGQVCTFVDVCASSPCSNGWCYSELTGFSCMCFPGWQGDFCDQDINECDEASAIKHDCDPTYGRCENTIGSYTCMCTGNSQGDGHTCTANILYPYHNILMESTDDMIKSQVIPGGMPYFGQLYWNIYISTNGYITLGMPYDLPNPWTNGNANLDVKLIAPYWTDLDLSVGSGSLYFDAYYSGQSQQSATEMFNRVKSDSEKYTMTNTTFHNFEPSYIGVITWRQVAPFPASQYKMQNVTFQCVLATDSRRSFVMFNYDRDHMFIDPGSNNWTISALLSKGANDVSTVSMNIYRPDKETNQGADDAGRFVFRLGEPVVNNNLACIQWYNNQDHDLIQANISMAEPCPCTSLQAELDPRFMPYNERPGCYKMVHAGDAWNLCCYDNETALLPSAGYSQLMLAADTADDFDRCCTATSLCHLYYEKRPADTCQGYKPPVWGAAWGEPHFHTFDGKTYTFNGLGEFILLSLNDGEFLLQGRTGLVSRMDDIVTNATIFTAFASQQAGWPKLELRLDPVNKDDINIRVSGNKVSTLTGLTQDMVINGIYLTKYGDQELGILHENGIGYRVRLAMKGLWIKISLPQKFKGQTVGLLGTFDGSADNDLMYRDGSTVLPPTANEEQIFECGKNWTVQQSESLFNYSFDGGKTYNDFQFAEFVPMWFTESLMNLSVVSGIDVNLANVVCQNSIPCVIDYIATGNINLANWTRQYDETNVVEGEKIMNFPPVFTTNLPSNLDVAIGQEVTLTLMADDPEQQLVQVKVNTNLETSDYSLENDVFHWTPSINLTQDGATVYLKFYAVDPLGAAALYWPSLNFCGCDRGSCKKLTDDVEYVYSRDQFYSGLCQCRPDSSGHYCSEPRDPCQPNPCYYNASCIADPESDKGYQCGSCPDGTVSTPEMKCYDINECLFMNNSCEQVCINQQGGYICSCQEGYTLRSDHISCMDVDECLANDLCTGLGEYCMNMPGGYKCVCKSNFYREQNQCIEAPRRYSGQIVFKVLKVNDNFMTFDPEMSDVNSEKFRIVAEQVENTVKKPFAMRFTDSFKKIQVYEIREGSMVAMFDLFFEEDDRINGTELDSILQQYLEMYDCVKHGPDCTVGPLIGVDMALSGAHEKDLCLDSRDNDCDSISTECFSMNGKFYCQCRKGFQKWLDYTNICQDIDECSEGLHDCDNKTSVCENRPGSYECLCRFGYRNQNGTCVDTCDPNPCQHGGLCVPIDNTNICLCQGNWIGPNCTDENEEALRMKNIAIAVSVTIGIICLILLVILIICCIRSRPIAENKYQNNSGVEPWTDSHPSAVRAQMKTEYEMKENGSAESLMQDNTHRTSHSSSSTGFDSSSGRQGVENPAYSNSGDAKQQVSVSGEYF